VVELHWGRASDWDICDRGVPWEMLLEQALDWPETLGTFGTFVTGVISLVAGARWEMPRGVVKVRGPGEADPCSLSRSYIQYSSGGLIKVQGFLQNGQGMV